ncbi:T-complex protein 11-like X-linked protein 1 isoform X1 [Paralichthys olivaceus]|uniref:T-complex protein 11-like X-linked protein 1 isoform X1 n=2 Tax=Paralichthys olivaceus TaxID=8255 RepID=UPI003751C2AE
MTRTVAEMANQGDKAADDLPRLEKRESPPESPPTTSSSGLMELENRISSMKLAHEITMNRELCFKLQETPMDSLVNRETEFNKRAFWEALQEQLNSDPPNYTHAVTVLKKIKITLQSLVLPQNIRQRSQIDEVLDMELIQQEADHGVLDLHRLMRFIINTMASHCAPYEDQEIQALSDLKDPVELLRNIIRVLELMLRGMLNFLRPFLLQQSVQYKRDAFQKILDMRPDILDNTTAWLQAAASESDSPSPDGHGPVNDILNRAYVRLLHWDPQDRKYPETVLMNKPRLDALGLRLKMLVLEASVLQLTKAQSGDAVFFLQEFVGKLRQTITALLEHSHTRDENLKGALLGLGEKILQQVNDTLKSQGQAALSQENQDLLKGQICDLWKHNNPVRTVIGERVQDYLRAMLQAGPAKFRLKLPVPLRLVRASLTELGTAFGQIVHFNQAVFGPFYTPIVQNLQFPPGEAEAGDNSSSAE